MKVLPRVIIYVDGFNLYYGAVKNSTYKWLDLVKLAKNVVGAGIDLVSLRYFTAKVKPPPWDKDKGMRQRMYIDALRATGLVEVHFGQFKQREKKGQLSSGIQCVCATCGSSVLAGQGEVVSIRTPEEKGSDVNLASYLMLDAAKDRFDVAWVISNDSDLATPIRLVREEFSKKVGVVFYHKGLPAQLSNPQKMSRELFAAAGKVHLFLQLKHLEQSLFPNEFTDEHGKQHRKPKTW